jgi:hypothetical protein
MSFLEKESSSAKTAVSGTMGRRKFPGTGRVWFCVSYSSANKDVAAPVAVSSAANSRRETEPVSVSFFIESSR